MNLQRHPRFLVALSLFIALVAPSVKAQTLNRRGLSFPSINLPGSFTGNNIPTALGPTLLTLLEAWYGVSDTDFKAICQRDGNSIRMDRQGRLHYVCAAATVQSGAPAGGSSVANASSAWGNTGTTLAEPFADSQTFLLHSKAGASKVIYLCFTGFTTSGTQWNTNYTSGANIVTPPYDIDGNTASFSSTELANIQTIWQSVAEDYAAFDVDVTTQDPGVEALRKTSTSDTAYGKRVCIGGSGLDWYGIASGGISYMSSFDWNIDTPVFVFPAQLGSGNPKFVAEACSHEVGHTFGLHHAGLSASAPSGATEYFQGQGSWCPIMGASYYENVTQWSKGEYQYANNTEDQIALINSFLAFKPDAVGNTTATATALSGSSLSASGLIESAADVDVFSFVTGAGSVSLLAQPAAPVSGDLNLVFSLYNSSGTLITSVGPSAASGGLAINSSLAAGTYYVAVSSAGSGNPLTTGFSNYGSIGQYKFTGTVVPSSNKAPTAAASGTPTTGMAPLAVTFSSAGSADSDGSVSSYSWNFGDGSAVSTTANPAHTYATVGTFTATLTVYDNYGIASAPVSVTITSKANRAPTAKAAATPATGTVPLVVTFSSSGSADTDGTIASYNWNFGDGTTSTSANPSHTYTTAGTFTATLTVTDNLGLASAPASVSITATAPVAKTVYISALTITKTKSGTSTYATVTATVKDQTGALKSSATVSGSWSGGLVSGSGSGKTATNGTVAIKSASTSKTGTITFTVSGITLSGFTFNSAQNAKSSISIAVP